MNPRPLKWLLPLMVTALILGACSSKESGTSQGGDGGGGNGKTSAGSTVGITDDTITVGYMQPDVEALADAGLAEDFDDPALAIEALVKDVNDRGGINGRKLKVNTYLFDVTKVPESLINVCSQVAEDDPNFVAFAFTYFGDGLACLAGDKGVPVLTGSSLAGTVHEQAKGNAFLFNNTFEEHQRALVTGLKATGDLKGLKLGVVNRDEPGAPEALDAGLKPALKDAGFDLAESAVITGGVMGDPASISAAVQQFKEAGVTGVVLLSNVFVSGNFMAEAERQGYKPTYFASDQSEVTSTLLLNFAPESQLASAKGVSWKRQGEKVTGQKPSKADQRCVEIRNKVKPPLDEQGTPSYDGFMSLCNMFTTMVTAIENSGDDPTRDSFKAALEAMDSFDLGTGSTGHFSKDDHTAPTAVRPVEFQLDCGCWVPTGDWIDAP